ncbi:hypothetical protein [Paracoccus aminovorans]|uniref:hypothetical protein n=1 Tax=Paracoccus aminovorans TaxID=34004 RepID=UPI000AC7DB6F|nr:hypothetical protein [Paracoccus aminovorans]
MSDEDWKRTVREPVEGHYALTQDGHLIGPMWWDGHVGVWRAGAKPPREGDWWHKSGRRYAYCDDGQDVIAVVSSASVKAIIEAHHGE